MKFFTSVEELLSIYGGMTGKEKKQAKKVFAYLIMRDLEEEIEATDILHCLKK